MTKTENIRDTIIKGLSKEQDFKGMVTAELNGFHYSATDIALPDSDGNCQVYRIAVIPHQREFAAE